MVGCNVANLVRLVLAISQCFRFGQAATVTSRRLRQPTLDQSATFPFVSIQGGGASDTYRTKVEFDKRCFSFIHDVITRQSISQEELAGTALQLCRDRDQAGTQRCKSWGAQLWVALNVKLGNVKPAESGKIGGTASYGEWCSNLYIFQTTGTLTPAAATPLLSGNPSTTAAPVARVQSEMPASQPSPPSTQRVAPVRVAPTEPPPSQVNRQVSITTSTTPEQPIVTAPLKQPSPQTNQPLVGFPFRSPTNASVRMQPLAGKSAFEHYCVEFAHTALTVSKSSDSEEFSESLVSLCDGAEGTVCKEWARDLWEVFVAKLQVSSRAKPPGGSRTYEEWCERIYDVKSRTPFPTAADLHINVPAAVNLNVVIPVAATQSISRKVVTMKGDAVTTKGDAVVAVFPFRLPNPPPGWKPLERFVDRTTFEHHCFSFIYAVGTTPDSSPKELVDKLRPLCQGASEQQCTSYSASLWGVLVARIGDTHKMQAPGPVSFAEWCNKVYATQLVTPIPTAVVAPDAASHSLAHVTANSAQAPPRNMTASHDTFADATPVTTTAPTAKTTTLLVDSSLTPTKKYAAAESVSRKAAENLAAARQAEKEAQDMLAAAKAKRTSRSPSVNQSEKLTPSTPLQLHDAALANSKLGPSVTSLNAAPSTNDASLEPVAYSSGWLSNFR